MNLGYSDADAVEDAFIFWGALLWGVILYLTYRVVRFGFTRLRQKLQKRNGRDV